MRQTLTFKKYKETDFTDYYHTVKEDNVMKYITGNGMTLEQAKVKFASIQAINKTDVALGYFQIVDEGLQSIIGECKLVHYKQDSSVYEIGYLVREEFWKKGYGTVICEHMLALAESLDPTKNIVGIIDPANHASKRLLEKFGFKSYFVGVEDNVPTEKLLLHARKTSQ